jgi:2'-5' RNA ligase
MKNKLSRAIARDVYFYGMNMYFVALVCPPEIDQQVLQWKLWMRDRYNCVIALRSPAHITLVPPFWMKPELDSELQHALSHYSASKDRFTIQLKDFSNFKPRVIFVNVIPSQQLADLQQQLFDYLLSSGQFPLAKEDHPFHPHVTIATRDLHKKSFQEAWAYFKEKKYEAVWMAEGITLLRHNKKNWDAIAASQFK